MIKKIAYLSGAPRVSTHDRVEASGPRSHVLGIINAFEAMGYEVNRFIKGDNVPADWNKEGSSVSLKKNVLVRLAADMVRLVFRFKNQRDSIKKLGVEYDFVYERFAAFQSVGSIFKRKGIPWVLETNAPLFYEAKHERKSIILSSLAFQLEKRAYKNCSLLVVVSHRLKDIIVDNLKIDPDKILVIPNGVDLKLFDVNKYSNSQGDEIKIGFVGTIQPWQRLDYLIESLAKARSQGHNISLEIVGDGMAKADLYDHAEKLGALSFVNFLGRVSRDKVPEIIAGFDVAYSAPQPMKVGMYLSPLKLYEYMAMGKPVIASSSEDAAELVINGKTGFTFDFDDPASLEKTLADLGNKKDTLLTMGRECTRIITESHSWVNRTQKIINELERKKLVNG